MQESIACYDNMEVMAILMPEYHDVDFKIKVTDQKGLLYGKQKFPWPLWNRDMAMTMTGMMDQKNHALISVSKSIDIGEKYFDYTVEAPKEEEQLVRMEVKRGYNFFQYLGPNKTRHVAIWNTDPKMEYVPTALLNFMMSNVLYTNMSNLQKLAQSLKDPEASKEIYKYYERKLPYYNSIVRAMNEPDFFQNNKKLLIKECPNHPANPKCPEHDPNHFDNWKSRY